MKLWQKRITSASDLPLGSKSEPPLPPPMGSVVRAFLNTCSKARNLRMPRLTARVEAQAALVRADGRVHLDAEPAVDLDLALVVGPGDPEHDHPLRLHQPLHDLGLLVLGVALDHQGRRFHHLQDRLVELRLGRVLGLDQCDDLLGVIPHTILRSPAASSARARLRERWLAVHHKSRPCSASIRSHHGAQRLTRITVRHAARCASRRTGPSARGTARSRGGAAITATARSSGR